MADEHRDTDQWPRFAIVTVPEPTGIPHGWDEELVGKGVPQSLFGLYEAANELTLLEVPGSGPLVRFGSCGSSGSICLEPSTGHVVHDIAVPTIHPRVVNASLDQFTASVRAVLDRFPFDSEGSGEDQELHEHKEYEVEWAHEDEVAERLENERTQAG